MIKLIKCNVAHGSPDILFERYINADHIVSVSYLIENEKEYAVLHLVQEGEVTLEMTREAFIAKIGAEVLDIT